jgi:hypothetical protein
MGWKTTLRSSAATSAHTAWYGPWLSGATGTSESRFDLESLEFAN